MDAERAETHLRLLAEAVLRQIAASPDSGERSRCIHRVMRAAQAMTAVRALDEELTNEILDDLELAAGIRPFDPGGKGGRPSRSWAPSAVARRRRAVPGLPRTPAPAAAPWIVSLGQAVPFHRLDALGQEARGEAFFMSYVQTATSARLAVSVRTPGRAEVAPRGVVPLHGAVATDDLGARYEMFFLGTPAGPHSWTGELWFDPSPWRPMRSLEFTAIRGDPPVRVDLTPGSRESPPAAVGVTVSAAARSPGEHLLDNIATDMLALAPADSRDKRLHLPGRRPGSVISVLNGLGDVVGALEASGALSTLSPVPGQLAGLCAALGISGHGISAPPADDMPARWLGVLAARRQENTGRRKAGQGSGGCALPATTLLEVDDVRLALLGLHCAPECTILHAYARGAALAGGDGPMTVTFSPRLWIRDGGGCWHVTRTVDFTTDHDHDYLMRLEVLPPLMLGTPWIEIYACGGSGETHARLPLTWRQW